MGAAKCASESFSVDGRSVDEDATLEQFGYQPELKRSFGLLGMIGFSFSIVTCWSALGGVLVAGISAGGPPVMIWGWCGISAVSLCVAYSMAEMCSEFPVAGGQYSWVFLLSPRSVRRQLSYITGWFMIIGILAMGATNSFIGANFVLGMANLANPDYVIERWHTSLTAYAFTLMALIINIYGEKLLNNISRGLLAFNIVSFLAIVLTLLIANDHKNSASFVFSDFQNTTGFGTGMAAIIGILQPAFGMCCYDAPAHMVEELNDARKQAPRAIVWAIYIGFITGFIFLVAVCFCLDYDTVADSSTGVPLLDVFLSSTNNTGGSIYLGFLMTVITFGAGNALLAEGSRALFAFARDNGLPFSRAISSVSATQHVPIVALLVGTVVQLAFESIYFVSSTGFNTIISIATQGFYLSYAMPLFVRLLAHINGSHRQLTGPYALTPLKSIIVNGIGLAYLLFACITFNFPSVYPVTADNMNYTSAATGAIMFIAVATWFTSARRTFSGPEVARVIEIIDGDTVKGNVAISEDSVSDHNRSEKV